jgi:hypothetical protein
LVREEFVRLNIHDVVVGGAARYLIGAAARDAAALR